MVLLAESDSLSAWPAFWGMLASGFWPLLVASLFLAFRNQIISAFRILSNRMKMGGALKIGSFELGAPNIDTITSDREIGSYSVVKDDGERAQDRQEHYDKTRSVMLVHRLSCSEHVDQIFDVLIYVIPHKTVLAGVAKVEYFFGEYWGDRIYSVTDRSRGFPVVVSTYGPMLCTAKVHFTDGESVTLYRYIDFEMGNLASTASKSKPEAENT